MTNKEIANAFRLLGIMIEVHGENPFKARSYNTASRNIRSLDQPLAEMSANEIGKLPGVGKAISDKIDSMLTSGSMPTLERYLQTTPTGLIEMASIKGISGKKVHTLWKKLNVVSPEQLLEACRDNKLTALKGFGKKSQQAMMEKVKYYLQHRGSKLYAEAVPFALSLMEKFKSYLPNDALLSPTGQYRRMEQVIERIEVIAGVEEDVKEGLFKDLKDDEEILLIEEDREDIIAGTYLEEVSFLLYLTSIEDFGRELIRTTGSSEFLESLPPEAMDGAAKTEVEAFEAASLPWIFPECREYPWKECVQEDLITLDEISGVVHAHSTYSDGTRSISEMARCAARKGYSYLGISDHSQTAVYAGGLTEAAVHQQWEEIDEINGQLEDIVVLKGIESDILADGSLDYTEGILAQFDFVIASIHGAQNMDIEKATRRLIRAVESPYTNILGHPTGRLLLLREGYPIDHEMVIDACVANGVAIEINANPRRLDMDWRWIRVALEKEAILSINPDAHSCEAIDNIRYGVAVARKGLLTSKNCLTSWPADKFLSFCNK